MQKRECEASELRQRGRNSNCEWMKENKKKEREMERIYALKLLKRETKEQEDKRK